MNSFTLTAIGNLARNPEVVTKGEHSCVRFCLIGNDYAGRDEEGGEREIATSVWFIAFGAIGEAIVRNVHRGDQLIVEAQVRADHWVDTQGERRRSHSYVVRGFRFGARGRTTREGLAEATAAEPAAAAG
jgi:single-strand DNA-binding protein